MERTELEWLTYLIKCHDAELDELKKFSMYYEGKQPLSYMAPELQAELQETVRQVVINWPRLVVDSVEERLDVEGFRYPAEPESDEELWRIWQANGLDGQSQQGHLEALLMGRAYVFTGTREADAKTPLVTVESALDVYGDHDPQTRELRAVIKRWREGDVEHAALRLLNANSWWLKEKGQWVPNPDRKRDEHNIGSTLVEVLANRPRLKCQNGVSDLADVIPISDAACKSATDMMVSEEYHATPRRVAFGFGEEDFVDANGRKVSAFSRIIGRMWATEKDRKNDGADVIQFPEASLSNFHETIKQLATLVASLAGLPPHFLGYATDNPASADAIRSAETRLVKRSERKQRGFGDTWERVMRNVLRVRDGDWNSDARALETIWRDASTPTIAQKADAAVKLFTAKVVPLRQTREDMGYTQAQINRMEEQDREAAQDAMTRILAGDLAALDIGPKAPPESAAEPDELALD